MSSDDIRYHQELRAHGVRVMNTVTQVLDLFPNRERVITHLQELGRKHVMFNAKADYIDVSI